MKTTKSMFNVELQKYYLPLRCFAFLLTKKWGIRLAHYMMGRARGKNIDGLQCEELYIPSNNNGPDIRMRIFRPNNTDKNLPAMLYAHGGGYEMGTPENFLGILQSFIDTRPCVIVAPDYRKSIDNPYPAGFNDCYDTLLWMRDNSASLNIEPSQFIVAGHSAGGGLAAAVSLKARDTKDVNIAFQIPAYPMIDHRQITESAMSLSTVPAWNSKTNALGWELYLKNVKGDIPEYASPALCKSYKDLPPTITFIGSLDPFKDETMNYVNNLKKANVPVEFELFEGVFHGFETVSLDAKISKKANQFQFQTFGKYLDKYFNREK